MRRHRPAMGLPHVPTREDHPIAPQHPYALSKYQGETGGTALAAGLSACRSTRSASSMPTARASAPRAPMERCSACSSSRSLPASLSRSIGDGTQRRDFLYVTDIAEAFLRAAETDRPDEIWNLGAGNPQSVNRLVELIGGPVVHIPKRPGEPDCTWADITKIQRDLGWKPVVPFEHGVQRMMEDIELWRDAPLWDPQSIAPATKTLV